MVKPLPEINLLPLEIQVHGNFQQQRTYRLGMINQLVIDAPQEMQLHLMSTFRLYKMEIAQHLLLPLLSQILLN